MTRARSLAWLERLIWTLIYGGLLALVLGLATGDADLVFGWSLAVVGALVALAGVVLIVVRARLGSDPPPGAQSGQGTNGRPSE